MLNHLSETDKAWLAGFVDGEGYIGIVRTKKKANQTQSDSLLYHPWIIITNTNLNIVEYILTVVSAQKRASLRRTEGQKASYQIKISKFENVIELLEYLLPYLRLKVEQAKLVIQFCNLRMDAKIITGRGSRGNSSFGEIEEKIYLQLRELNKRGQ